MNTNIFQAIRVTVFLGVAFFAFASDALAAPILTPATATRVTENSAMLVGHVSNPYKSTAVWFEVFNDTGSFVAVGVQPPLYDGGTSVTFEYLLRDLNQGQTYSYRSAAMEGGVTVYSPTSSFTTLVPKVVTPTTIAPAPAPVSVVKETKTTTQTAAAVVEKPTPVAPVAPSEGFTNGNSAAVIGGMSDIFPKTLIGWLVLVVAILVVVLLGHMVYESIEKRKKALEEKELKELEEEEVVTA